MKRRTFYKRLQLLLAIAVVTTLTVAGIAPAIAAKGGKKGDGGSSATISVVESAPFVIGQDINFATSGSRSSTPWIRVSCYQDGERVYFESNPVGGNYFSDDTFTLGPTPSWTSGDASCQAKLGFFARNGRWRVEASTSFNVNG